MPPLYAVVFVGFLGFVAAERRSPHPLISLRMVRIPAVSGSLCALFAIQFAILGLTVYLTLYLQLALHYSPATAGALTLPTVVCAPLLATAVGRMTDRLGARALLAGSMLLAAAALAVISLLSDQAATTAFISGFRVAMLVAAALAAVAALVSWMLLRESSGVSEAAHSGHLGSVVIAGATRRRGSGR